VRPEDQVLRQVASDVWCGRVVASWFAICVPPSGASDPQNAQNARYYFCWWLDLTLSNSAMSCIKYKNQVRFWVFALKNKNASREVPGTQDTRLVLVLMWNGSFEPRNRYHLNCHTILVRARWDRTEQLAFEGFAKVPLTSYTTPLEKFSSLLKFPSFAILWSAPNFLRIL